MHTHTHNAPLSTNIRTCRQKNPLEIQDVDAHRGRTATQSTNYSKDGKLFIFGGKTKGGQYKNYLGCVIILPPNAEISTAALNHKDEDSDGIKAFFGHVLTSY
jgi:hypothetical protein